MILAQYEITSNGMEVSVIEPMAIAFFHLDYLLDVQLIRHTMLLQLPSTEIPFIGFSCLGSFVLALIAIQSFSLYSGMVAGVTAGATLGLSFMLFDEAQGALKRYRKKRELREKCSSEIHRLRAILNRAAVHLS